MENFGDVRKLFSFKFLTPSIRVWPQDLLDPRSHLFGPVRPRSLHFPVAPPRAGEIIKQVDEISEMLESKGEARWSPELIWEPFPVSRQFEPAQPSKKTQLMEDSILAIPEQLYA